RSPAAGRSGPLAGPSRLEGNVVVTAAADGCALEVRGVRGHVAAGAEDANAVATALTAAVPRAEELDRVGDDADRLPLTAAVFRLPLAPVEASLDRHRPALGEVFGAVLALGAPDGHVEVVGLVDPFARLPVLAPAVDSHAQLADRSAAAGMAQLRVAGQIPGDHNHIHVRSRHGSHSSRSLFPTLSLRAGSAPLCPPGGENPQRGGLTRRSRR